MFYYPLVYEDPDPAAGVTVAVAVNIVAGVQGVLDSARGDALGDGSSQ